MHEATELDDWAYQRYMEKAKVGLTFVRIIFWAHAFLCRLVFCEPENRQLFISDGMRAFNDGFFRGMADEGAPVRVIESLKRRIGAP